jgi:hypothetical protein
MFNRILNESVIPEDADKVVALIKGIDANETFSDTIRGKVWLNIVAQAGQGGLPDGFEDFEKKFEPFEIKLREGTAIPSKRPGGARSKGTGYVLHPTLKSYKSTIKGAYEHNVELLDASGNVRSRDDVSEDIKAAKATDKTPEEKLVAVTGTWLKLFADCDKSDASTIGSLKLILDAARDAGLVTDSTVLAAVA